MPCPLHTPTPYTLPLPPSEVNAEQIGKLQARVAKLEGKVKALTTIIGSQATRIHGLLERDGIGQVERIKRNALGTEDTPADD